MCAMRENTAWHKICEDDDTALDVGIVGGMSSFTMLIVILLTVFRFERSLVPA